MKKYNLTGQLREMNREVESLNADTGELVDTLGILDEKEGGLERSVSLLALMREKTESQIETTRELAEILSGGRLKVTSVLELAREVLAVEQDLRGDTELETRMAGRTLELVRLLYGNLSSFRYVNEGINTKLDRALEIMRKM